jgi:hypothetical protein
MYIDIHDNIHQNRMDCKWPTAKSNKALALYFYTCKYLDIDIDIYIHIRV